MSRSIRPYSPVAGTSPTVRRPLAAWAAGLALFALAAAAPAQTWTREVLDADLYAWALAVAPDGRAAVLHEREDLYGATLFAPTGDVLASWDLVPFDGAELTIVNALFLDDGALALCGSIDSRPWVGAVDPATGLLLWGRRLTDTTVTGSLTEMTVNSIGHLVLLGTLAGPGRTFLAAVNPATGGVHYRREFPGPLASDLVVAEDGAMFIVTSGDWSGLDLWRLTDWGQVVWHNTWGADVVVRNPQIVQTTDGSLTVLGTFQDNGFETFYAAGFASTGGMLWERAYETYSSGLYFQGVAEMFPTADGGVLAAVGQPAPGDAGQEAAMVRLGPGGDLVWFRSYGIVGDDWSTDLHLFADGGSLLLSHQKGQGFRLARLDTASDSPGCGWQPVGVVDVSLAASLPATVFSSYTNVDGLWADTAITPSASATVTTLVCGDVCAVTAGTYGTGTAGSSGLVPSLVTQDGPCFGDTPALEFDDALGGAPGLVLLGFGPAQIPALGGTVLVHPGGMLIVGIQLGGLPGIPGTGQLTLPTGGDLTAAQGLTLYVQGVFGDPGAASGKSLTNGVTLEVE